MVWESNVSRNSDYEAKFPDQKHFSFNGSKKMFPVTQTERIILENNVSEKNDSALFFPGQKHFSFLGLKKMFLVHAE